MISQSAAHSEGIPSPKLPAEEEEEFQELPAAFRKVR